MRPPGHGPRALIGGAGHARPGPREGAGQRPPAPAPRRPDCGRLVHQMRKASPRAGSQNVRELRREAPRRRPRPSRKSPNRRQALRRPGSRSLPPRRPRRRQAPPPGAARRGPMHRLRPQSSRGRPYRLRALPRGEARDRSPALRRAQGRRCLRALRRAGDRRLFALLPARRAGGRTVLARAQEHRWQEALRPSAR